MASHENLVKKDRGVSGKGRKDPNFVHPGELSQEELLPDGVPRVSFDDRDQLREQVAELSEFRDRFHEAEKERAVLQEGMGLLLAERDRLRQRVAELSEFRARFYEAEKKRSVSEKSMRIVLAERDQLRQQVTEVGEFRERFYDAERHSAVLKESTRKSVASEIIYGTCLTVGATLIGFTPFLWEAKPQGLMSLAAGVILILGGIASKVVRK